MKLNSFTTLNKTRVLEIFLSSSDVLYTVLHWAALYSVLFALHSVVVLCCFLFYCLHCITLLCCVVLCCFLLYCMCCIDLHVLFCIDTTIRGGSRGWPVLLGTRSDFCLLELLLVFWCGPTSGDTVKFVGWIRP